MGLMIKNLFDFSMKNFHCKKKITCNNIECCVLRILKSAVISPLSSIFSISCSMAFKRVRTVPELRLIVSLNSSSRCFNSKFYGENKN